MTKSSSGKKGFISSQTLFYPGGKPVQVEKGRNQEADTEAEAIEECCSLACPPWLAQYAVLYTLGPPAQRWHCRRWTGHGLIHHQSRKHCTAQSDEGILSTEFPLHRWLKWASNNNKTKKTWSRHLAKRIPRKDGVSMRNSRRKQTELTPINSGISSHGEQGHSISWEFSSFRVGTSYSMLGTMASIFGW